MFGGAVGCPRSRDSLPACWLDRVQRSRGVLLKLCNLPQNILFQQARWATGIKQDEIRQILQSVGMSGYSFGAVITQWLSGQQSTRGGSIFTDTRIDAAVVMSPSSPSSGTPQAAFGKVALPWLLITGTKDTAPIGNANMESRLAVFSALPPGDKYELVLHGAKHSAFSDWDWPWNRHIVL